MTGVGQVRNIMKEHRVKEKKSYGIVYNEELYYWIHLSEYPSVFDF